MIFLFSSRKAKVPMITTREFPINMFDAASHADPTLLPTARQFVAEGNIVPFIAPRPSLGVEEQQYRLILDQTLAEHIFANPSFTASATDPRAIAAIPQIAQNYPNLFKLSDYLVFHLPEGNIHLAVRGLFSQALAGFSPQKDLIQEEAQLWVEHLASMQGDIDLVESCCALASNVMLRFLGLPRADKSFFHHCRAMELMADLGGSPERYAQADQGVKVLWEEYETLLADPEVRKEVGEGMLRFMVASDQFTDQDIVRMILMLIILSSANTAGVLYRLLLRLSKNVEQRIIFQENPTANVAKAVNAGLWADVAVWYILRHVGEGGAVVDGYEFAPWSHVVIMPYLIEHLKEDPAFDILKYGNTRVFSFGKPGTLHYCLGEGFARVVTREALLAANAYSLIERIHATDQIVQSGSSFFLHPESHLVQLR